MRPPRGRQKLFDAALELFESQGYFATSVESITAQAGVSKGLVYNYFSSKEELLAGLIEEATARMTSVATVLDSSQSPDQSLSSFLDQYFGLLQSERRFLKLQLNLMLMPELRDVVLEPQRKRAALLLDTMTGWFRKAAAAQPSARARLFVATLDGIALHYLFIYERYPLKAMKEQLLRLGSELLMTADSRGPT